MILVLIELMSENLFEQSYSRLNFEIGNIYFSKYDTVIFLRVLFNPLVIIGAVSLWDWFG